MYIWLGFLSRNYWSLLEHDLMASILEKAILFFWENLNSGRGYLITAVNQSQILGITFHYVRLFKLHNYFISGTQLP